LKGGLISETERKKKGGTLGKEKGDRKDSTGEQKLSER